MNDSISPLKKSLATIAKEDAHGGSGQRQVIFSKIDNVTKSLEAWTKGFLPVGSMYDWHSHKDIDEYFIVEQGDGHIEYANGDVFKYTKGDIIFNPANIEHRIINDDQIENIFYFIRIENK